MRSFGLRLLAVAALASLLALSSGCGNSAGTIGGPNGDAGGEHLLVFATDRPGLAGGFDIALYDLDASGYRALPGLNSALAESEPTLSDDGLLIAFGTDRTGGAGGSDILLYGRSSQSVLVAPNLNTVANETYPRFTYDSNKLAFVRDSLGWKRVRLYEAFGDSLRSLPGMSYPGAFHDEAPAPDLHGDRIAFSSTRAGASHVYVWNRSGGLAAISELVGDSLDGEPSLSSNGRWLAFASNRSGGAGGWDVYLYDLTSNTLVPLPRLNTAGEERHPAVNAAGTRIVFQSRATPADTWDLWSWTMSDSTLRQPAGLSAAAANDQQPYLRWR